MSKAKGAGSAFGKVLTYILVVLLLLGIVGGVAYFFMRSQGMTFYVEYSGTRYLANGESGSVALLNGTSPTFTVKSLTGEEVNYSVKVTSNGANNFSFTTNDEFWYLWNDDEAKDDYTDVFEVEKGTDGLQAQSYEEVQPILGVIHQLYTDLVVGGEFSGNSDVRTALSAYVALFRAVEDREYTADEAASVREDLGDLMERYEPME